MKKILILAMLSILSACQESTTSHKTTSTAAKEYPFKIYETSYKGHDYIVFSGSNGNMYGHNSGFSSGVVHSPECRKCKIKHCEYETNSTD